MSFHIPKKYTGECNYFNFNTQRLASQYKRKLKCITSFMTKNKHWMVAFPSDKLCKTLPRCNWDLLKGPVVEKSNMYMYMPVIHNFIVPACAHAIKRDFDELQPRLSIYDSSTISRTIVFDVANVSLCGVTNSMKHKNHFIPVLG